MANIKATIEIRYCPCVSAYQDTKYGRGQRVHNLSQGGKKTGSRCTVCGAKK